VTNMDDLKSRCLRLKREIEARTAELNQEISRYPGPIARCDAQLAGLLEERARLSRLAAALEEFAAIPATFREPA